MMKDKILYQQIITTELKNAKELLESSKGEKLDLYSYYKGYYEGLEFLLKIIKK